MVTYTDSDIIPIYKFPYAWRITDKQWDHLSPAVLQQIKPFSTVRSTLICQRGRFFRDTDSDRYYVSSTHSLGMTEPADNTLIQQWFCELPIEQTEQVYVSWGDNIALTTNWSVVINEWDNLWYPFDAVDIFDDALEWAILLGPEETASFLKKK